MNHSKFTHFLNNINYNYVLLCNTSNNNHTNVKFTCVLLNTYVRDRKDVIMEQLITHQNLTTKLGTPLFHLHICRMFLHTQINNVLVVV